MQSLLQEILENINYFVMQLYCVYAFRADTFHDQWRHQMETFSMLLAICAGNSPVTGEFPTQRPVTQSFDVLFDLRLNKRLSKQWWGWWFEMPSCPLWCHCTFLCAYNAVYILIFGKMYMWNLFAYSNLISCCISMLYNQLCVCGVKIMSCLQHLCSRISFGDKLIEIELNRIKDQSFRIWYSWVSL